MRNLLPAVLLLIPLTANAQIVSGNGVAVDGDTLELGGERVRLHGIDALEAAQTCKKSGAVWQCGHEAKALLTNLVAGKAVVCEQRDRDAYDRIVATCRAGGLDLAEIMVEAGLAVSLPRFGTAYVEDEGRVRALRVGMWGSEFDIPETYRAAHPNLAPVQRVKPSSRQAGSRSTGYRYSAAPVAYFRNCSEARAAGAAPIYRGQPGYRSEMDGDDDGVACEPFRGR